MNINSGLNRRRINRLTPSNVTLPLVNTTLLNNRFSPYNVVNRNLTNRQQRNNDRRSNLMNPTFLNRNIGLIRSNLSPRFLPNTVSQYRQSLNSGVFNNRNGNNQLFMNGGMVSNSQAFNTSTQAPIATGFTLTNAGERNTTFSKEFVADFLIATIDDFTCTAITTHPAINSSTIAVANVYQRYKILNYQFKYKATCSTVVAGLHYTGVDYGTQTRIPKNFKEAQTLEHFSVGPIWKDSQDWHTLKQNNIRERWFDINQNSQDPDSRPARIIFGSLGSVSDTTINLGLIEVRVTYLFSGLGQSFTGEPPSKMVTIINGTPKQYLSSNQRSEQTDSPDLVDYDENENVTQ